MELSPENGRCISDPTPADIEQTLLTLNGRTNDFVILSKSQVTYLQAAGSISDGFTLEYQDGDTKKHFKATDEKIPFDRLLTAFQDYAAGQDHWQSRFTWEKCVVKMGPIGRILILLFVAFMLFLIWKTIKSM